MNDIQRQRMEQLRDFLLSGKAKEKFTMGSWYNDAELGGLIIKRLDNKVHVGSLWNHEFQRSGPVETLMHGCGTAACALGWSIALNPPTAEDEVFGMFSGDLDHQEYAKQYLGVDSFGLQFGYAFSGAWSGFDDTPEGAAYRIDRLLSGVTTDEIDAEYYNGSECRARYLENRNNWFKKRGITL